MGFPYPGVTAMLEAQSIEYTEHEYGPWLAEMRAAGYHEEYQACPVGCRGSGLGECSVAVLQPWSWLSSDQRAYFGRYGVLPL